MYRREQKRGRDPTIGVATISGRDNPGDLIVDKRKGNKPHKVSYKKDMKSFTYSVRVDTQALAIVCKFMEDNGLLEEGNKGGNISKAIDILSEILVKNGMGRFRDREEASSYLLSIGMVSEKGRGKVKEAMLINEAVEGVTDTRVDLSSNAISSNSFKRKEESAEEKIKRLLGDSNKEENNTPVLTTPVERGGYVMDLAIEKGFNSSTISERNQEWVRTGIGDFHLEDEVS